MFRYLTANPRRIIATAASGLLLAAPLIVATESSSTAAGPSPVSITIDYGMSGQGFDYSETYQVSNVTPGAGFEMTGKPGERTGGTELGIPLPGLRVDVDPAAQTVTVLPPTGGPAGLNLPPNFWPPVTDLKVDISSADMSGLFPVNDTLFSEGCPFCRGSQVGSAPRAGAPGDPSNTNVTRTTTGGPGHWATSWHSPTMSFLDGAAVFRYTLPAPQVSPAKSFAFGNVGKPTGKPEVGNKLTAPSLTLPAGATETFQWYRLSNASGHSRSKLRAIRGAHGKKYKLRKQDKGTRIFVRMRVSAPGYNTAAVDSRRKRIH